MKDKIGIALFKIFLFFLIAAALASIVIAASANYGQGAYGSGIYGNEDPSSPTTDSSSSGSSSSGSSELTAQTPPAESSAHFWASADEGSTLSMKVTSETIAVSQIEVVVSNALKNVEISVAKISSEPVNEKPAGTSVYQYLDIKKKNAKDGDISKATVRFEVAKSWITNNKILPEDVVLKHYKNDRWEELPTAIIKKDAKNLPDGNANSDVVVYESTTGSFSYFAVAIKEKAIGAGALPAEICSESWECIEWGKCEDGMQKRVCADKNLCNTTKSKPEESKDCSKLAEGTPKDEAAKKSPINIGKIFLWILVLAGIAGAGIFGRYIYQNYSEYASQGAKEASPIGRIALSEDDTARLNGYIIKCLSKGFKPEIIEKKLISVGWQKDIVDRNILEIIRRRN